MFAENCHNLLVEALLKASIDPAVALDGSGRIVHANESARQIIRTGSVPAEIWNSVGGVGSILELQRLEPPAQPKRFSNLVTRFGKLDGCLSPLAQAVDDVSALLTFRVVGNEPSNKNGLNGLENGASHRDDTADCGCSGSVGADASSSPGFGSTTADFAIDHELYKTVIDEAPVLLAVKDARSREFLLTRGAGVIGLHVEEEKNVGKTADDLFEPALAKAIREAEDELIASGETLQERIFTTAVNNEERSFLSKRKVIRADDGEALYLLLINVDVTHEVHIHKELSRSQTFLQHVIQNLPCLVDVTDVESGETVLTNADNVLNAKSLETEDALLLEGIHLAMKQQKQDGSMAVGANREFEFEVKKRRVHDDAGEAEFVISVAEDTTEKRRFIESLERSEASLRRSQEVAKLGSFTQDLVTGQLEWSPTLFRIWGTKPSEFRPEPSKILEKLPEEERGEYLGLVNHIIRSKKGGSLSGRIVRFDDVILHVKVDIEPEFAEDGTVNRLFGIVQDISERVKAEAHMRYLAHHDGLTTLPNRVLLEERLERARLLAKRHGSAYAVHCIDLNDFKGINDGLGHSAGDALLREVADRLSSVVRESDTVARLGADEFAIVQEGIESEEDAALLAERLQQALKSPFTIEGKDVFSTSTIGISFVQYVADDKVDALQQADMALNEAKKFYRGQSRFFSPSINAALKRRKRIDQRLRSALNDNLFTMAFQPQLCLQSNKIIGAEALARWHDPELGTVPPDQFIPIAEELGLILSLGEFALRHSCEIARQWIDDGLGELRMAVNLSPAQFAYQDLAELVSQVLDETKLPAELLELEITEGVLMRDRMGAVETIKRLHKLGVSMAIDDFGSGYSSLSYLKRFNVEKIKIDRSFVRDLPDDPDDIAITQTILSLGRSLNMSVLAEGVEEQSQLDFLAESGCDEIQGYFIAKPLPDNEFRDLMRTHLRPQ